MRCVAVMLAALIVVSACGSEAPEAAELDPVAAQQYEAESWAEIERRTAACMAAQGFDYVERRFVVRSNAAFGASPFDLTPEAASANGFGIVDGVTNAQPPEADPNVAVESGLDERTRTEWNAALHGGDGRGCRSAATSEVRADTATPLVAIEQALVERGALIEADPRYGQLWADWSACMRSGHGIETVDLAQLQASIAGQAGALAVSDVAPPAPDGGEPAVAAAEPPDAELAGLRQFEIEAASATVDCLAPLEPRWLEIQHDVDERMN